MMKIPPDCPYCRAESVLVTGASVYPRRPDLADRSFYMCTQCDAYVGTHPGTHVPLGRLANAELRAAKRSAHAAFDPLWKTGGLSRRKAYLVLAWLLQINPVRAHIGMMDEQMCCKVVEVCGRFTGFSEDEYQTALTWAKCHFTRGKKS